MTRVHIRSCDRRTFIRIGLGGLACTCAPSILPVRAADLPEGEKPKEVAIREVVREETLFAGIRKPMQERAELQPRIKAVEEACGAKASGPLTHILRFDTPVEGYDSEIGFPVSAPVNKGEVKTHTLRSLHFYSTPHEGSPDTLRETIGELYQYMHRTGLSPELELVEVYHHRDPGKPEKTKVEVMAAFLPWPEVYREQLVRVLGGDAARAIWKGGEKMTPHTLVDPRCAWVAASIQRLKERSTLEQQFDILSRVALVRPGEDVMKYKRLYDETKDLQAVFRAQDEQLKKTRTGGFIDPPRFDGKILHVSKVPYNGEAYKAAKTQEEKRKAYCFCNLVREAKDPKIDPIFCYRAAGWARQFWEPILGVEFSKCVITHSILKGDGFCAWDYHLG
jgi:effector-binding domain-containing protein